MLRQNLPKHHRAWLDSHPHRTVEWLKEKNRDGFDIHHIDGDRTNNDPKNLVLLDSLDHMILHDMPQPLKWFRPPNEPVLPSPPVKELLISAMKQFPEGECRSSIYKCCGLQSRIKLSDLKVMLEGLIESGVVESLIAKRGYRDTTLYRLARGLPPLGE